MLKEATNKIYPLSFRNKISRHVTKSVLPAVVVSFIDLCHESYAVRSKLEHALQ